MNEQVREFPIKITVRVEFTDRSVQEHEVDLDAFAHWMAGPGPTGGDNRPGPDEITTTVAEREYGLSAETWRRLARDGKISFRWHADHTGLLNRRTRMLNRAEVAAEMKRRGSRRRVARNGLRAVG